MGDERNRHRGQFRTCQDPLTDLVGLPLRNRMSTRRHRSRFVIPKNRHLIEPAGFGLAGDNEFRFAPELCQFRTRPDRGHELQPRRPMTMHAVALEHRLHRCKTSRLRARRHTACQGIQRCQRHHGNTDRSFHECRKLRRQCASRPYSSLLPRPASTGFCSHPHASCEHTNRAMAATSPSSGLRPSPPADSPRSPQRITRPPFQTHASLRHGPTFRGSDHV